ncbi:MAG: hypothetical protein GF398_10600 [Chitinivibrionales bacterium]|nr:hypothetical protein [Chitinivibrionales bacterium]
MCLFPAIVTLLLGMAGIATAQPEPFEVVDTISVDSLLAGDPAKREDAHKLKIVKRTFKYRQQIGLSVLMMGFILVIMTTAQSLNPD